MQDVLEHKQEAAITDKSSLESLKKSWVDYRSWSGGFNDDIKKQEKIHGEAGEQLRFLQQVRKGEVNHQSADRLKHMYTDLQAKDVGKLTQIDQRANRIGNLPENLSKVNGHIITIDREKGKADAERSAAWFASENTQSGRQLIQRSSRGEKLRVRQSRKFEASLNQ